MGARWVVEQLDQSRTDLLRPAPPLLMLQRMPLAIADLKAAMQRHRQLQGLRRPTGWRL